MANTTARAGLLVVMVAMAAAGCSTLTGGSSIGSVDQIFITGAATWDVDKDGVVTCDEWKAYAGDLFTRADLDRDGSLTPDEFKRVAAEDKLFEVADFAYFDRTKRGRLTRVEMVDRPNPAFALLDNDKNCRLTTAELAGSRAALQGNTAASGPAEDRGTPGAKRW